MSDLDHISDGLAGRQSIGEGIVAEKLDVVKKPQDWDKSVSAAYLRLLGLSQKKAAKGAGLGERTLARYELSEWWPDACREAVDRWMQQLEIEARTTVMVAVKNGDVGTAWKVLERLDRRLAPPRQSHGIEHSGEIVSEAPAMSVEEIFERAQKIVTRLAPQMNHGAPPT